MIEPTALQPPPPPKGPLWAKAQALESAFLSEMLAHAGLGSARDNFGGGAGEDQFASFLRDTQAESMAKAGGIGLAQSIFDALMRHEAPT
jgi:flagellar protein FlgJ